MEYKDIFPDFDDLTDVVPMGFTDTSNYDDGMPSFTDEKSGLILFIDYVDSERRLNPDAERFALFKFDPGHEGRVGEVLTETDDHNEIMEYIALNRPSLCNVG